MNKKYLKELDPFISFVYTKKYNTTLELVKDNKELPFLKKLGFRNKAVVSEFVNLAMLSWAFGYKREEIELIKTIEEVKNPVLKFLIKLLNKEDGKIFIEKTIGRKCNPFKDFIAIYTFTVLAKAIVAKNFENDFSLKELREDIINKLIGTDEEKEVIDSFFVNDLKEEDLKQAMQFIKNNNIESLLSLIKSYFNCELTKDVFTEQDIKVLLNAFDFTK